MTRLSHCLAAALLSLAACDGEAAAPSGNQAESAPAPVPEKLTKPVTAFQYSREIDELKLDYRWPGQVSAIPELVQRFTRQLNKSQARLAEVARIDRQERQRAGASVHAFRSETAIHSAGQTPRLLSLSAAVAEYTGGAHANYGTTAVLWDRLKRREMAFAGLFTDPANRDRVLLQRWCDALDAERSRRRDGVQPAGPFNDCPPLGDIAVIPTDKDGDARFDRLMLVASPYVAGPFSEGYYEIALPVDAALVAVLKTDYRPSFQPQ